MLLMIVTRLLIALAAFQDLGPLMWTGKKAGDASDASPTEKDAGKWASELRRQAEALQTLTAVNRDFAKQLPALDRMRALANWSYDFPGKAEIVSEIAEVRADWLEKLGRHADAVFAAQHPLVMPEEKNKPPYDSLVWAASNGSLAQLAKEIDALPRMVALRKRFSADAPAAQAGDAIEDAVRKEIKDGDPRHLKNFGARCAPALRRVLLEEPDQLSPRLDADMDPLLVLLTVDRTGGLEFVLSTLGKRGPIWAMRVIESLQRLEATSLDAWIGNPDPYAPPTFGDPLTLRVIDALAEDALSASRYFTLLTSLVMNDVVTPAIKAFLLNQTQATDPAILKSLRVMLDGARSGPNKRALYEAFLDSSDPALRLQSAAALRFYPVGPATLRATRHSDPNVRRWALHALVRHFDDPYNYEKGTVQHQGNRREFAVPRTAEVSAALLGLARDPERSVRTELVRVLQASLEEPPAEMLDVLLADADPEVRQAAAYDWSFKPELQARALEALAVDKDPQVLRSVGFALNRIFSPGSDRRAPEERFQPCLRALAKWLTNPATSVAFDPNAGPNIPVRGALLSPEGARAVFEACTEGPHRKELVAVLLDSVAWSRDRQAGVGIVDTLDAPRIAELFALCCATWNSNQVDRVQQGVFESVARGELDAKLFLALGRDEGQSRTTRLRALTIAASKAGPELLEAVLGLLRGVTPAELATGDQSCRDFLNLLEKMLRFWPELEQARPAVCADVRIPDGPALYVVGCGYRSAPLDAATTRACLQRWARLDEGWKSWDRGLLYHLDPGVEPAVIELWRDSYRVPVLSDSVVGAMAKYPRDESVPMLTECVRAEWMSGTGNAEELRTEAIRALTMRLDELGADALLKAISSARNDDTRKKCFDGLEQIRKYQDEKQSWQQRKGGAAAREQAVADLLPMLSDKDASIRAAAARSLGTLQAVEHLPKLVALLKDKDASVREAAQKALDALNAAPAKKP